MVLQQVKDGLLFYTTPTRKGSEEEYIPGKHYKTYWQIFVLYVIISRKTSTRPANSEIYLDTNILNSSVTPSGGLPCSIDVELSKVLIIYQGKISKVLLGNPTSGKHHACRQVPQSGIEADAARIHDCILTRDFKSNDPKLLQDSE
ncbi:hypothetical protein CEXT_363081 [Caerostris extrusa]|uniref:Uncharacterized protein n=1 Tax=Caerostris extrusa TaxID=172846 RepID=A0AAV4NFY4_CAEEX|nr:hypothetical protein CEXT_363081 [Caerostris extrusa]